MLHSMPLCCNSSESFGLAEPVIRHCSGASQLFLSCLFQGKVKVRRASISEPSDTEHESQALPFSAGKACSSSSVIQQLSCLQSDECFGMVTTVMLPKFSFYRSGSTASEGDGAHGQLQRSLWC